MTTMKSRHKLFKSCTEAVIDVWIDQSRYCLGCGLGWAQGIMY